MLGSYNINVTPGKLPQKVATAFGEIFSNMVGAEYTPIAYLGDKVVSGVNHAILATQTMITGTDVHNVVLVVLNEKDDQRRRRGGGEYPANSIIELLIAFSSRKEKVNPSDNVADEFTKLDITDMTGKREFAENFYHSLGIMVRFDQAVSRYQLNDSDADGNQKFTNGMDLFTQMPAKTGFIVALAQHVVGRAGTPEKSQAEQEEIMNRTEDAFNAFINRLNQMENDQLGHFLRFDVLNELILGLPVKRIGDAQREFFRKGFATLIECSFEVEDLEVVWRAY